MFILNILIISTVILTAELVTEKNVDNVFSERNCGLNFAELFPDYGPLEIASRFQQNSKCGRSGLESCTPTAISHCPVRCFALTIFVRLYSNEGGLKITLFNENDRLRATSNFAKFDKRYNKEWNQNVLNVMKNVVGYSQSTISDQNQRLNQDQSESPNPDQSQNQYLDRNSKPNQDQNQSLKLNQSHNSNANQNQYQNPDQTQNPNRDKSVSPNPNQSQNLNLYQNSKAYQIQNQSLKRNQTHTSNLDQNQSSNTDQNPNQNQDQISNEDVETFWNPFTISLVTIITTVVIAVCFVSAYHLGKIRARADNQIIIDDVQPSRIIPRIKRTCQNPLYNDILRV